VEKHLQLFSLTRLEWHVLCAVFGEGTVRPSQIADYVGANRTQISRALRVLETKGLLTRGLGRDDRRSTEIILTEHGKEKIRTVLPGWRKANLHFHAKLGDEDLDELLRLLCKLTNNEVG
jgi:DNA-binding MarR family transcriptional regulator